MTVVARSCRWICTSGLSAPLRSGRTAPSAREDRKPRVAGGAAGPPSASLYLYLSRGLTKRQIAVAPGGDAHVVWLDAREGKGNCLFYAKVTGGKPGRNVRITPPVCPCCAPGIALDGKGNPFVAYREMADDASREIFLTISRDGGNSFAKPARVNRKDTRIPD